ncbi:hypothetical protein GA0070558_1567 [Micromonospora haikouensis]|uniref:Uncharacterized protein n=1 Tax=Micromonospora haikouensis TaxID=686309 RepID=A0A1C4YMG9_9ACTN|nr:hypothetical protein GA0070558_1567 [Micromonospora haikouensis]
MTGFKALRTVFRETPSRRQMALIAIRSARCNRRISAQSSTLSTSRCFRKESRFSRNHGVSFQAEPTRSAARTQFRSVS